MPDNPDTIMKSLDMALEGAPFNVGVAMGIGLYGECKERGLLLMKEFTAFTTGILPHGLPTYRGMHFAFVHPDFGNWDFQVGSEPVHRHAQTEAQE